MNWQPMAAVHLYYPKHWLFNKPLQVMLDDATLLVIYPGEKKRFSYSKSAKRLFVQHNSKTSNSVQLSAIGNDQKLVIKQSLTGSIMLQTE